MYRKINPTILKRFLKLLDKGRDVDESLEKFPEYRDELKTYLKIINRLDIFKNIEPNKGFADETLKKIYINKKVKSIQENAYQSKETLSLSRFRPAFLKTAIIFISFLVFLTFSYAGTIYAAEDSVPGETLYSFKRISENIQIFITPNSGEGKLYREFLDERIKEADILLMTDAQVDARLVESLISDIDYTYGMCKKYGCIAHDEDKALSKRMQGIKESFTDKSENHSSKDGHNGSGKSKK